MLKLCKLCGYTVEDDSILCENCNREFHGRMLEIRALEQAGCPVPSYPFQPIPVTIVEGSVDWMDSLSRRSQNKLKLQKENKMKSKKEIEIEFNAKILDLVSGGGSVSGYEDTGHSFKVYCNEGLGDHLFEMQYETLEEDDICECWGGEGKSLFYFSSYEGNKPKFKRYKKDKVSISFDHYRIVERANHE
jgi:hypothetical protein